MADVTDLRSAARTGDLAAHRVARGRRGALRGWGSPNDVCQF
jgi:hypothetical protein